MKEVIVTVEPTGRIIQGVLNRSLLEVFTESGVGIRSECGGHGVCGKCKVIIDTSSKISDITQQEIQLLSHAELARGYRLACQTFLKDNITIMLPLESRVRQRQILVEGIQTVFEIHSPVRKLRAQPVLATLSDPRTDTDRVMTFLNDVYSLPDLQMSYAALQKLPTILRSSKGSVTITVWKDHVIVDIEKGDTTQQAYGFAIDIGTSKLVGQLTSLTDGRIIATHSIENPQMIHGEDVISRITYSSSQSTGLTDLRSLVIDGINKLITSTCQETGVMPQQIYEMTLVGNSAMHHILLGIPPLTLAIAPYVPAIKTPLDLQPNELGFYMNKGGNVHVLPLIAGFVGSDNVADVLATQVHTQEALTLLIDIGTNTEVNLGNMEGLMCCSCASGPAFEGAHIQDGMKAVDGAIERVSIDPTDQTLAYEVIGGGRPVGLCGSAMIDILAELHRNNLLDHTGRLTQSMRSERMQEINGSRQFVIAWRAETDKDEDIVITQGDIRELQLAKAAIYTGCAFLMRRRGITTTDIERVYIAGAFGNYIQPENAIQIGLIPDVYPQKVTMVGNAALSGARMALLSLKRREEALKISNTLSYIELGAEPNFNDELISATFLPHRDPSRFQSYKNA